MKPTGRFQWELSAVFETDRTGDKALTKEADRFTAIGFFCHVRKPQNESRNIFYARVELSHTEKG